MSPSSALDSVSAIQDNAFQNLRHIQQIAKVIILLLLTGQNRLHRVWQTTLE